MSSRPRLLLRVPANYYLIINDGSTLLCCSNILALAATLVVTTALYLKTPHRPPTCAHTFSFVSTEVGAADSAHQHSEEIIHMPPITGGGVSNRHRRYSTVS